MFGPFVRSSTALLPCDRTLGETRIARLPGVREHRDAVYVPKRAGIPFDADSEWGIYDRDGRALEAAAYRRGPGPRRVGGGDDLSAVLSSPLAEAPDVPHLYVGTLHTHYGHFVLSGIARLWALASVVRPLRLLYHGDQVPKGLLELPYVSDCLTALGVEAANLVRYDRPVRIATLTVPEPTFEEQHAAHPLHAALTCAVGRRLRGGVAGSSRFSAPVYLSKARLTAGVGRAVNEAEIADSLERRGVTVLHPERMPFADQIRAFETSPVIAGLLSSAFHTSLFASRPNRLVALNHDGLVSSSFHLVDRLKGNRSTYLRPRAAVEYQGTRDGFHINTRYPDPARLADDLLREIDRALGWAGRLRRRRA